MEAPEDTSVISEESNSPKGVINFATELIPLIKTKRKTVTFRLGDKYSYLRPDDILEICEYGSKDLVSKAKVTKIDELTFKELPVEYPGHESYRDKEHQREVFNGYYSYTGKNINDDDKFLVICFEIIS